VVNEGSQVHNLVIEGDGQTADLASGDSEVLSLSGLDTGDYVVFCSIPGHRDAGMEAAMTIEEGAEISQDDPHGGANPDYAQLDTDMLDSFQPFVDQITSGEANTEGKGAGEIEPVIDPDGYKRFDLTATIGEWETEPGVTVEAWMFNETVPGPTIRVNVGDKVRVRLINNLPLGTDIHLHGIRKDNEFDGVAPLTQDLTMQGDTFDYEFTAIEPAVGMYHPHAHGYLAIPNGMWGAILVSSDDLLPRGQTVSGVEIPADLDPVMEDVMVLNDSGNIGLSLNGKSFPGTAGYEFNTGDWVAMHYYNEGLQIHPMHLHQFPQLVYAKDGIPLDNPYWADTVNVAPGERYSVIFQAKDPGVWVWHCHILTHVERESGMFGMVTALVVADEETS
jgi:manganese oxidase